MRSSLVARFGLACSVLLAGCHSTPQKSSLAAPARADAGDAVASSKTSNQVAAADAGPPTPQLPKGQGKLDVDLLHWSPASVGVSSNVDNPRDYPEHLVDGKPETAWNGRTGDLTARIAFRVPKGAYVRRIELSAGFDKKGPKGDLFTMNHRIKRVRVTREGDDGAESASSKVIGEFTLDTSQRLPQPIPVGGSGGVYLIDVLEAEPGTNKAWRELVVSELHVMGEPGASKLAKARIPRVVVLHKPPPFSTDKLPPTLADVEANPTDPPSAWEKLFPVKGATAAAVCAAYEAALAPVIASELSEDRWPGPPAKPYCKLGGALFAGFRPTSDVTGVRDVTLKSPYATHRAFILETKSGAVLTFDAVFAGEGDDGIETASSKVLDLRVEDRELRLRVAAERKRERYCAGPAEPTDFAIMTSEFDLRCPLEASPLTCTRIDRRESCRGFSCESFGLADEGAPR